MNQPLSSPPALKATQLRELRAQALQQNRSLCEVLGQAQGVSTRAAAAALAQQFGMPHWDSPQLAQTQPAFALWPLARAMLTKCVLVRAQGTALDDARGGELVAVVHDPFDTDLITQVEQRAQRAVSLALSTPEDIHAYLHQQEAQIRAVESIDQSTEHAPTLAHAVESLSLSSVSQAASPAVKLVNSTLYDALRVGASDVHLESTPSGMTVKYRIDGVLDEIMQMPGREIAQQTISRLKVLSDLDIAESRVPQDGSFQVQAQERLIDLRVSIMPSIHGEDAVIRILDKQAMIEAHGKLSLEALGFNAGALSTLRDLMDLPHGMLLVTGPTGSGKTTTLYAALAETQTGRDKIITIEDPVEYQLPGILQIPVNEKKGLTFARGLRSILRHDPDKIMVGEIRDKETAEIAVQSALTGHLVLSTVHANNVFDVFGRFTHMGLDPYALVSALNGIWAQRLLRVNCPHCVQAYTPKEQDVQRCGITPDQYQRYSFKRGLGCGDCRGSGYKGRRAVAEFLVLDDELREMIVQRQSMRAIKEQARARGTRTLLDASLDLVRDGLTTLEEVRRVTLSA